MTYDWIQERKLQRAKEKFNSQLAKLRHEYDDDIRAVLIATYNRHGNAADAAAELGISRATFYNWCRRYHLKTTQVLVETDA